MIDPALSTPCMIAPPDPPLFDADASLHFLPGGHYLLCHHKEPKLSKFVTSGDVAAAFTGADQDTGWIPPGVVRVGRCARGPYFVYSTPPQRRLVMLVSGPSTVQRLVPLPRLVMLGVGSAYYLWAVVTPHFNPSATVYQAPFPNIYRNGSICWGDNRPPEALPDQARKAWDLFFDSPFNGHLVEGKSKRFPLDVRLHLSSIAGTRRFPHDDLEQTSNSLEWLVNSTLS